MVLILNGIIGILISVKAIKLSSWKAWVQHSMVAHLACSILSRNALMPASLDVKPSEILSEIEQ